MRSLALFFFLGVACASLAAVAGPRSVTPDEPSERPVGCDRRRLGMRQAKGVTRVRAQIEVSASFLVFMLRRGLPRSSISVRGRGALRDHRDPRDPNPHEGGFLNNLVAARVDRAPRRHADPGPRPRVATTRGLSSSSGRSRSGVFELSWLILAPLTITYDGYSPAWSPRTLLEHLPSALINVGAGPWPGADDLRSRWELAGIAFTLVGRARVLVCMGSSWGARRGPAPSSTCPLSWDVLAGLLRALDTRDQPAARGVRGRGPVPQPR